MSNEVSSLALLGGEPAFDRVLPVGQLNWPEWQDIEKTFHGIFDRRYYTNHGPLTEQLEDRLARHLGVRHALCMTNATIGLMIAAVALSLKGKVIVPGFTFVASAQSISWAGLEPVFCDVDAATHQISVKHVESLIDDDVSAIMGVHLWGNPCDITSLGQIAGRHGIPVYYDAAQAFGSSFGDRLVAGFGELEVISFHATKVMNSMEGGCVCTDDDELAARLRNIRSSYGSGPPVPIPFTGNGRFSEAQAAMALLSLDQFSANDKRNHQNWHRYKDRLAQIEGLRIPDLVAGSHSNEQYVVFEVDENGYGLDRDQLTRILHAENINCRGYFTPGLHRSYPYADWYPQYRYELPVTDDLCQKVMQLPSGQSISCSDIDQICSLILQVHHHAPEIRRRLRNT